MMISIKKAAKLMLATTLLVACGLSTTAQTITPGLPTPGYVTIGSTASQSFSFSGATFSRWDVRGGLTGSSVTSSITVTSNSESKGRVTAFYWTTATCTGGGTYQVEGSVSVDVFKTFTPPAIIGPACASPGNQVAFAIPPVLSRPTDIAAGIGIDTYTWTIYKNTVGAGNDVTSSLVSTTNTSTNFAGDRSAVNFIVPAVTSSSYARTYVIQAVVGSKNAATGTVTKTINLNAAAPVLTPAGPICQNTNDLTTVSFSVSAASLTPNTTYTWKYPVGWVPQYSNSGSSINSSVIFTPYGNSSGSVSVVANAGTGCIGVESAPVQFNRQLTASDILDVSPIVNCYLVGNNYTFSVRNAPANTVFTWTYPSGWNVIPAGGPVTGASITLSPGSSAQNGTVTVKASSATCASGATKSVNVNVSGQPVTGCGYTSANSSIPGVIDHLYSMSANSGNTCYRGPSDPNISGMPPTGLVNNTYTFTVIDPGTGLPVSSAIVGTNPKVVTYPTTTAQFAGGTWPGYTVTVRVQNDFYCLDQTDTHLTGQTNRIASGGGGSVPSSTTPAAARRLNATGVEIYPNPASETVNLLLPENLKGYAQVSVYDVNGRQVRQEKINASMSQLDVSRLTTGTYTVKVELPDGTTQSSVVSVRH